jgi:small subunit ribosomal protein S5
LKFIWKVAMKDKNLQETEAEGIDDKEAVEAAAEEEGVTLESGAPEAAAPGPEPQHVAAARPPEGRRGRDRRDEPPKEWMPRTRLGKRVLKGEFKAIEDVLSSGELILEPGVVDFLLPDLKAEMVYIGGSPGKGGGIRRTATKRTARMHKSGRRYKLTAMVVVGNEKGIVGVGKGSSKEHRIAIDKATEQAKLSVIRVRLACGSWECGCSESHSIPFRTESKYGSVRVILMPAPRGTGIVASKAAKMILSMAGIRDVWVKTHGQTGTRSNLINATFEALRGLNRTKGAL